MRRKLTALGLATALVGSGVVIGAMVPAASQQGGPTTIRLCDQDRTGYERDVNVGRRGFSPGDSAVFIDRLLNPVTGDRAGRLVGKVVFVKLFRQPQDARFIADVTVSLPRGKISLYGTARFREFRRGAKVAVVGGTGAYNRVRGAALLQQGRCRGRSGIRLTLNLYRQ